MNPYDTDNFEEEPPPLFSTNSATNSSSSPYTPTTKNNNTNNSNNNSLRLDRQGSTNSVAAATSLNTSIFGSASPLTPTPRSGQFSRDGFTPLNGSKDSTSEENPNSRIFLGLWIAFVALMIGLFTGFHSKIFALLEALAGSIKGLGPWGPPVIMLCLFATSFPPVIGYSSVITMAGYVYGFLFGFTIVFLAALSGAIVCFYFCRRWFKPQVRELLAKDKSLKSVVRTVERSGFRLLVLIRLAPYPFNIMNALLSATHISIQTFALATALSLSKLTVHVYVGSTLSSLTGENGDGNDDGTGEPGNPSNGHGKALKIVVMVLGVFLGFGVGAYVWMVTKREIAIAEADRLERRRRRRREQSLRRELNSDRSTTGAGNAIELSDHIPGVDLTGRELSFDRMARGRQTSGSSEHVGGYREGYRDEEEDVHEGQSLFGRLGLGRNSQNQRGDEWRNAGANVNSLSGTDNSDFSDDDDGDDEEEEAEVGEYGADLNVLERGSNFRGEIGQDDGEGALDFSAHHMGLVESPWQDDEEAEGGDSADLLNTNREEGGRPGGGDLWDRGW
ncbi:hypothetical protein BGZ80_003233 [Entomortierella chlamydospora]|uniref:Golgi apparatus membrane protein TVP38 n=1 Tax=Entomortierella chlamydospora TaxID=101097 RepID=A0A9P6MNT8_9FUNG|nr:hypothetical protein BGZ79_000679 [Entomortierella chlamydospora]KAG0008626.1 hypothetical protein BGZ80_003233 [Entomortierella chlamydospora]